MAKKPYGKLVGDIFFYFLADKEIYNGLAGQTGWTEGVPNGKASELMDVTSALRHRVTVKYKVVSGGGIGQATTTKFRTGKLFVDSSKLTKAIEELPGKNYRGNTIVSAYIQKKRAFA